MMSPVGIPVCHLGMWMVVVKLELPERPCPRMSGFSLIWMPRRMAVMPRIALVGDGRVLGPLPVPQRSCHPL